MNLLTFTLTENRDGSVTLMIDTSDGRTALMIEKPDGYEYLWMRKEDALVMIEKIKNMVHDEKCNP